MEANLRIFCFSVLCTTVVLVQFEQHAKAATPFPNPSSAKERLTTSAIPDIVDLLQIIPNLPNRPEEPEEQWVCETDARYCLYMSSGPKTWLEATESCSALGGMLPFWLGFEDKRLFADEAKAKSWSSLYWDAGRWHEIDEDTYSPAYLGHLVVNDAVLRHIAKGEHCFAIGSWGLDGSGVRKGISIPASPFQVMGHKCNSTLPFMCITWQANFNETQRKLRLPLKQVIDIEYEKIAGLGRPGRPGTQALRCVPKFDVAYDNLKDRPFNVVWILDDAYYPREGIQHGDHSTTITVPYKHFTKYACEVRYLGSIYGNRSQEIEGAIPSKNKLGLIIRVRNATFFNSSLDYAKPIKELVEMINNDSNVFNLSQVGDPLFEQEDSDLIIATYLLSNTSQEGKLIDMIKYTERIKFLYFNKQRWDENLVSVQFFEVDRCPLKRGVSYFWAGGAGEEVQPSLTGDKPTEMCLDEYDFPVTRTCSGSLISGAQWVEPFSEEQNCSRASNKSTGTFCRAGYSLTTLAVQKGAYCVKEVPSRTWNDAMDACFGGDILTLSEQSVLYQYDTTTWVHNTIDYLTRGNTSGSLMGSLLWLPSRRRVPDGPLYPYMLPIGIVKQINLSSHYDWEVSLPGNAGSDSERLSYWDLDPSQFCLAWSVKNRTLTTRSCSERHPTVCIVDSGHPVGSREVYSFQEQVSSYYIPACHGFDVIMADAFSLNSCQKLVRAHASNASVSVSFTWEEAQMQCQTFHNGATLAIPARYPLSAKIAKTRMRFEDLKATWFGVRKSGGRSNTSCRFVTSTNQCADPIYGFSNDTDFLHGVYVSSSGTGQDSLTLRLPETRLTHAVCQVYFQLALLDETPVTYHLKLAWKDRTGNTLKLYLTREGRLLPGYDWGKILKHDWQFIHLGLVCFGDGLLFDKPDVGHNEVMEMYLEFPAFFTSFHCESRTSTAIFLRSNTVLWRQARFTFVVTARDRRVRIVPETEVFRIFQSNATVAPSRPRREATDSEDVSRIAYSRFAEIFEPTKVSDYHFRYNGSVDIELGSDNYPSEIRKYTVLNTKYVSYNYEELLVRFHVLVKSPAENLKMAFKQLGDDMEFLMKKINRPDHDVEALRSMVTCLEEVEERPHGNLTWIETPLDGTTFSREGCVFEGGSLVQRTCIGDIYYGAYWGPTQAWNAEGLLVSLSSKFSCASPSKTTFRLLNMAETPQNATSALAGLQEVTSQWNAIIADVQLTALIFSNASRKETEFSQVNVEQTANIIQQVLSVSTEILANAQRLPNVSTNLLIGIEEILTSTNSNESTLIASSLRGNSAKLTRSYKTYKKKLTRPFLFTANSSNLGELNDTVANTRIIRSTSPSVTGNHQHDALVVLNVSSLMVNWINASQIAFVYHPNIRLADAAVAARETSAKVYSPNPSDGDHDMLRTAKHTANSAMVQVAAVGGPVYNISELVHIYFRPFRACNTSNSSSSIVCAFWNPEVSNGRGGWSTQGCSYQGNVGDLNHCQCNHLSSFTTFFAYDFYEPTIHDSILDPLTKIGCGLSLLGCIGVIATYTIFPKWRLPKPGYYGNHVIFQLSLALALLLSTFLGGFDQTNNGRVCLLVAAFLHYLMLVVFFWMLVEAYCHYVLFVKVMGSLTSNFMLKASLFAWVLPLVPVIALVVWNTELYYYTDGNKFCWLTPSGFYYALLPFASLIGLINLALYIIIIVKVGCAKSTIRSTQSKRSFTHYTAVVIFFVMGLSWVFGLLAIGHARIVFSYLFCIFNSLQGFAIFLHFICRGKMAHEHWQNFIEGKSDRDKARDKLPDKPKHSKPSSNSIGGATSEIALSKSTSSIPPRIIGELKNRQRLQKHPEYETSNL